MTRVWQWNRPVTVREVLEDLQKERSIAYTTVMTVMDNLHQKGWVRREVEGRAYRYTAVSTRAAYAAALMNEAWSKSDNPAAALVAFFGMMSPEQRGSLADAVRIVRADRPEGGPEGGPERGREGGAEARTEGSTEGSTESDRTESDRTEDLRTQEPPPRDVVRDAVRDAARDVTEGADVPPEAGR